MSECECMSVFVYVRPCGIVIHMYHVMQIYKSMHIRLEGLLAILFILCYRAKQLRILQTFIYKYIIKLQDIGLT